MVTKAYLDTKLPLVLNQIFVEAGPDSLLEALRTAYPSSRRSMNAYTKETIIRLWRGGITPLAIKYCEQNEVRFDLDRTRVGGVVSIGSYEVSDFSTILEEVINAIGEYLAESNASKGDSKAEASSAVSFSQALAPYSETFERYFSLDIPSGIRKSASVAKTMPSHDTRRTEFSHESFPRNSQAYKSRRTSISGWVVSALGLYLIMSGIFNLCQLLGLFGSGIASINNASLFLQKYGLLAENASVALVFSYVAGAPIFIGSTMMAIGSIARRRR